MRRLVASCREQGLQTCSGQASRCCGFCCCGARALGAWASAVAARGLRRGSSQTLEHQISSGGSWASLCTLPGPGIEPTSAAVAGRFFATEPPGKPRLFVLTGKGDYSATSQKPFTSFNRFFERIWLMEMTSIGKSTP